MKITIDIDNDTVQAVRTWRDTGVYDAPTIPDGRSTYGTGMAEWVTHAYHVEPIRRDQQQALFAAFSRTYGTTEQSYRYAFTRLVLKQRPWQNASWRDLTADQAHKMLDVLEVIEGMCDHADASE